MACQTSDSALWRAGLLNVIQPIPCSSTCASMRSVANCRIMDMFSVGTAQAGSGRLMIFALWPAALYSGEKYAFLRTGDAKALEKVGSNAPIHNGAAELIVGSKGGMDFALTDDQELIRSAVAKVCADYPDEYWAEKDQNHDFPWDFIPMANVLIGTAIPRPMAAVVWELLRPA